MHGKTPQEIAREAVKLLAARRLPPTPDNFQAVYHEVAGTRPLRPFPLENLRQIGNQLPDGTPGQQRFKVLFNKAVNLHSWDDLCRVITHQLHHTGAPTTPQATRVSEPAAEVQAFPPDIREQMARIVTHALPAVGNDDARVLQQAQELVEYLRLDHQHPPTLRQMMADFAFRLSFVAQEQADLREGLLNLLRTVLAHIRDISPDTPWLQTQLDALVQAAEPPLNTRRLDALERQLKDLSIKQVEAQEQAQRARLLMKDTLSTFLERLAQTTENSTHYQTKFERCATELEQAHSLADMAPVLQDAIQSARSMAVDSQRTSDELHGLRDRAHQAEAEIDRLRQELDRLSHVARHDLLTGVLNRRGLTDVVEREIARAERSGKGICLALIDIDDFKRLNDELGHNAGDAALVHLTAVAQRSLRPQDAVARYGGEEFIIVLPDTTLSEAEATIQRLQRELSTHLFLQGQQKLLITFSAGVTELGMGESVEAGISRADQAMYQAKRAGKNRVMAV